MRIFLHGIAAIALSVLAAGAADAQLAANCSDGIVLDGCAEACDINCGTVCCDPIWRASVGAIALKRSNARYGVVAENARTGAIVASTDDFNLQTAVGPRVTISRQINCCWDAEFVYFGIDGWDTRRVFADPNNVRVPLVGNGPRDLFDVGAASYSSALYNVEFNLKRRLGDSLAIVAGVRHDALHEEVGATATGQFLEGTVGIRTNNYLYGAQLGLDALLWGSECSRARLDGFLRAGAYSNFIRGYAFGRGTQIDFEDAGTTHRTSFVGEVGVKGTFALTDNLSLFAGYEAMWIEGVSLAGNAVAALSDADISIFDGTAFYHGVLGGVEYSW